MAAAALRLPGKEFLQQCVPLNDDCFVKTEKPFIEQGQTSLKRVDQMRVVARTKTVIDIDDTDAVGAGVQHS